MWLLALSPRMRAALPRICGGEEVVQAAAAAIAAAAAAERSQNNKIAGAAHAYMGNSRHGFGGAQRSSSPAHAAATVVQVPRELRAVWKALGDAAAFCARCSRAVTAPRQPNAHQGPHRSPAHHAPHSTGTGGSSGLVGSSGGQDDGHEFWFQLMKVFVGLLRAADEAIPGAGAVHAAGPGSSAPASSSSVSTGAATSAASSSSAGPTSESASVPGWRARALRAIWVAALEEVVGRAADHVPLPRLVARLTGLSEGVGGGLAALRSPLMGLLRCAWALACVLCTRTRVGGSAASEMDLHVVA